MGDISAGRDDPGSISVNYFSADQLDFEVGLLGDLIDEITDGQPGTFGKYVLDVLTLHIVQLFKFTHQRPFLSGRDVRFILILFGRGSE